MLLTIILGQISELKNIKCVQIDLIFMITVFITELQ